VAKTGGVLVVDFGAQYAQLIARRVREANVYSEIVPSTIKAQEVKDKNPSAIILSGGPSSVYAENAPKIDEAIFTLGVPIFGICYGFQVMAATLGGVVTRTGKSEFGRTQTTVVSESKTFGGLYSQQKTWMSHGDAVTKAPEGFTTTASTESTPIAAFENATGTLAGVQFHPEVLHTEHGQKILENWLINIANCGATWTTKNIAETEIAHAREIIGNKRVICGLSGGVDSAVAAAIIQRAVGDQLTCVFVDHGLLRGITDPEEKRKIIGREFIRAFESAARDIASDADVEFLVQGTLYPDVVESGGGTGTANIKSHHNVGGLPDDLKFKLIEPLRSLFKDEVRQVGIELGLPEEIVWRQPFPGPGLAIRIVGEVTQERLALLRHADAITREELKLAELDRDIWQCPVVLLADVRSVGVQGDGRTYGHPIVLRPVSSEDAMTADWSRIPYEVLEKISTRITNEVPDVNRVVLDVTSKPPGTIEWE